MNEQLDMMRLRSPISGIVDAVDIKIGQALAPGIPAVRVVNMNTMKVKGDVPESFAGHVKKGNKVRVEFPDMHSFINGELTYSARVINPMTRTFSIEMKLSEDMDYRPNMLAVTKVIDYTKDLAMVVPVNVIQNTEEGTFVYVAETQNGKNVARRIRVTAGLDYNGQSEILSGLNSGMILIVTGYQDLNDGQRIEF